MTSRTKAMKICDRIDRGFSFIGDRFYPSLGDYSRDRRDGTNRRAKTGFDKNSSFQRVFETHTHRFRRTNSFTRNNHTRSRSRRFDQITIISQSFGSSFVSSTEAPKMRIMLIVMLNSIRLQ